MFCRNTGVSYVSYEIIQGGTREWADATPISFKMEYYII